jgi:hypothetical protein
MIGMDVSASDSLDVVEVVERDENLHQVAPRMARGSALWP